MRILPRWSAPRAIRACHFVFHGALVFVVMMLAMFLPVDSPFTTPRAVASPPATAGAVCITRQELTARAAGLVSKFHVADGARVRKGAPIVEFDARQLRAGIKEAQGATDAAKANVDLAEDAAGRLSQLQAGDTVTAQQVAQARIQVAQAKAVHRQAQGALERLRVQLEDTVIRAEIPGQVRGLPSILGMAVQPGQSLGRVEADPSDACRRNPT